MARESSARCDANIRDVVDGHRLDTHFESVAGVCGRQAGWIRVGVLRVPLIFDMVKQRGCTALIVTHDDRILNLAERVLCIEDGRLTQPAAMVELAA